MYNGTFKVDVDGNLLVLMGMRKKRITHNQLAEQLGIPIATYYRIKSGQGYERFLKILHDLCQILECTPNDLLIEVVEDTDK